MQDLPKALIIHDLRHQTALFDPLIDRLIVGNRPVGKLAAFRWFDRLEGIQPAISFSHSYNAQHATDTKNRIAVRIRTNAVKLRLVPNG